MSHRAYNKLWARAQEQLYDLICEELRVQALPPEESKRAFLQRLNTFYILYVQIFRELEEAYDQLVHTQKRRLIRYVLEGVMGRLLELKHTMTKVTASEYHYMEDILLDMKLTPADMEIPIPRHFLGERATELWQREAMLSAAVTGWVVAVERSELEKEVRPLTRDGAVRMLQVSERARQGRRRAEFERKVKREENAMRRRARPPNEGPRESTALCIQRMWKGYLQRKRTSAERDDELVLLGMASPTGCDSTSLGLSPSLATAATNEARRHQIRDENEARYKEAIATATKKLKEAELLNMKEEMKGQIRQWIAECYDATGALPDYPDEGEGGSVLIFAEKVPEHMQAELGVPGPPEAEVKMGQTDEPGFRIPLSKFLPGLEAAHKTIAMFWQNRDQLDSLDQMHDTELIKGERRKEVEAEARLQVDRLMREELANLKLAMGVDPGGGKAKGKGKEKKVKKGKKEKDLTPHRSVQSLFQELAEEGLLKPAHTVWLRDYLGSFAYLGLTLQQAGIESTPSTTDVRQLIALYAVIPLGSQVIQEKASLVKTILLVGPAGVGKRMLVHAICQETGANLFDLSPLNLAGKYPGKSGLQMMLHMVFKVARLMQPSVIWIGGAEKMFYKKVPKEEKEANPKRLKKDLPKILKSIATDRVLVMGTSRDPSSADLKSLCKMYAKVILLPLPDYASRNVLWKRLIEKAGGEVTKALILGTLAKMSEGYTQGQIAQMVQSVLTEKRLQQLATRPLIAAEFTPMLAEFKPMTQDAENLKNWFAKTPQGKAQSDAAAENNGNISVAAEKDKQTNEKI
ncbi:hypothetical protein AAFF_G00026740 [Aldrovandia affinis]|uniref:ATPase AAA-type core domain-containing protein n=1 Tax=Aldrovandia affinis TaxID=143900 RepID=A0AAD7WG83_9TELE|nr:hypothetical protein AAFF_G00026740 [Aldrovandia affinis]